MLFPSSSKHRLSQSHGLSHRPYHSGVVALMKACSTAEKPLLQGLPLQATVLPAKSQLPLKL